MKHCKTLFVLVAAAIVMLTPGCARQTVHPVPIRYNFLDHIPDYDPMLLDTEAVPAPDPITPKAAPAADHSGRLAQPVPIRYRFAVPEFPVEDPSFPGNGLVAEALPVEDLMVKKETAVRYRFRFVLDAVAGPDPMLQNLTPGSQRSEALKGATVAAATTPATKFRFEFKSDATPDPDSMLTGNDHAGALHVRTEKAALAKGFGIPAHHPAPIRFRFDVSPIPDHDPMLQQTESIAGKAPAKRDSTLTAASGTAALYR